MTAGRWASLVLASTGLLTVIGSLGWWWMSYGDVYRYDYLTLGQAGFCLVGESEICRFAASLCRSRHSFVGPLFVEGDLARSVVPFRQPDREPHQSGACVIGGTAGQPG